MATKDSYELITAAAVHRGMDIWLNSSDHSPGVVSIIEAHKDDTITITTSRGARRLLAAQQVIRRV